MPTAPSPPADTARPAETAPDPGAETVAPASGLACDGATPPAERRLDLHRLRSPSTRLAVAAAGLAALAEAFGAIVVGRLAEGPSAGTVAVLGVCLIGAALLDTVGRVVWAGVVDRAEGRLRTDLVDAVVSQPLPDLADQAAGEILDRVDDDTHEVGTLLRRDAWRVIRLVMASGPLLVVAGLTWWPAWLLFPVTAALVASVVRPLLGPLAERKVVEEEAWSEHAAAMEEAIAARDDVRTSLGQAHVLRRCTTLAAVCFDRLVDVVTIEARITRRAGALLHALLAGVAVAGFALVAGGAQSSATLVTLFVVTTTFVGQIDQVARHLPELQSGMGAVVRLRTLLASPAEPTGGRRISDAPLDVVVRDLHFAHRDGTFELVDIDLVIPAGTTCALVGRSGSGKSTLAALLSRAIEPERGSVFVGGDDVLDLDLTSLRSTIGVVTQRTELVAGTLEENITLFADVDRGVVADALDELGLAEWVAALPDGLDTLLGPGGVTLSAGEEQLVAFARLLVRDVGVIVLDEATARMDPVTETQVVRAAERLLSGRTGIVIAHRLGTTERADAVAVLDGGRLVEHGDRAGLAASDGAFARLMRDAQRDASPAWAAPAPGMPAVPSVRTTRRRGPVPAEPDIAPIPRLARSTWRGVFTHVEWGVLAVALFTVSAMTGAYGAVTGFLWGRLVVDLQDGARPAGLLVALVGSLLVAPFALAAAVRRFPAWWVSILLRIRTSVLVGQTRQHRLASTPPGEVVARAMDAERFARYCDRWFDVAVGALIIVVTAVLGGTALAGLVLLAVMVLTAICSSLGSPVAGRSAAASSTARAGFGRSLVSVLDSIRTVKLAAATDDVRRHLMRVDGGRVDAAVREHRVQGWLDGVPIVLVQSGVVTAWAVYVAGGWSLATALLVSGAVSGFDWFGRVAGAVITEAPGTRAWQVATARLAGGGELLELPDGVDLVRGDSPPATAGACEPLSRLELRDVSVVHDDGTIGVEGVDLTVERGESVLLLGPVGSGKSSLLAALAGLVTIEGDVVWNGQPVTDREAFLRPGRVAYVAQVPRVLSGTFADNVELGHDRSLDGPLADARLARDIADAGGADAVIGHRGVRLSGGQAQRLALARALATEASLLVADDVSSALDATTEVELWDGLRGRGITVIGSTTKEAALVRADRVVVIVDGRLADQGRWADLASAWGHLAG